MKESQYIIFIAMDILRNIIAIRKEKGVSQEYISSCLGKDANVFNKIENGKRELKASELTKIADALEVHVTYLFTYPTIWEPSSSSSSSSSSNKNNLNDIEITLQFKLPLNKRDEVLKILGTNADLFNNK